MGWSSSQVVPIIHNRKEKLTGKQIYQVKNQIWYVEIKPKYIAQELKASHKVKSERDQLFLKTYLNRFKSEGSIVQLSI